jgi:hypothetical protein
MLYKCKPFDKLRFYANDVVCILKFLYPCSLPRVLAGTWDIHALYQVHVLAATNGTIHDLYQMWLAAINGTSTLFNMCVGGYKWDIHALYQMC